MSAVLDEKVTVVQAPAAGSPGRAVLALADEFGYWPATTDETNGRAPWSQKSRADPSSVRR